MHEEFSARETWPLECLHCRHVWQEEYLVRRLNDGHGRDVVIWTRSGVLVQPPWSGVSCPACGDSSVKAFPAGDRSHHADVASTPAPILVVEPGPEPADRLPAPAGRGRARGGIPVLGRYGPPVLLYALAGIAFLLLAGFEVAGHVVMHH
ncbi:hypothetical protein FHR32_000041 [Streptosporangium album]|uniref:Uncharacterized protein n=1 Tax=Streptosporangium album TaxID=47479 RepID=A0A7W7RPH3_9ACTN|nr:hypothetical protein [Streptosporangium album]MBB4935736.1 hypothetical protein [Streptosporangium album]